MIYCINNKLSKRFTLFAKTKKCLFLKDGPEGGVQIPFSSPNKPAVSTLKSTTSCIGLLNALEGASSLVPHLKKIVLTSP